MRLRRLGGRTLAAAMACAACAACAETAWQTTVVAPLDGEKWWGGALERGWEMPYGSTSRPVDLRTEDGVTAPFLVSSAGRYVWSDRPFVYAFTNGVLTVSSETERVAPVAAGATPTSPRARATFRSPGARRPSCSSPGPSGTTGSRSRSRA